MKFKKLIILAISIWIVIILVFIVKINKLNNDNDEYLYRNTAHDISNPKDAENIVQDILYNNTGKEFLIKKIDCFPNSTNKCDLELYSQRYSEFSFYALYPDYFYLDNTINLSKLKIVYYGYLYSIEMTQQINQVLNIDNIKITVNLDPEYYDHLKDDLTSEIKCDDLVDLKFRFILNGESENNKQQIREFINKLYTKSYEPFK